jgi:dihydrofolate reductase
MKITYYVAISLDEFIARKNGDVSWLDDLNIDMNETGYDEFFASVDGLVMGRSTYEFVFNYGSWPYGNKPTWICTSNELGSMVGANLNFSKCIDCVVKEAEVMGLNHLWLVGGGKLASSFLNSGLLTHLSISEMPVKLGGGIPLFSNHKLGTLSTGKTEVILKNGFKQIEISLNN